MSEARDVRPPGRRTSPGLLVLLLVLSLALLALLVQRGLLLTFVGAFSALIWLWLVLFVLFLALFLFSVLGLDGARRLAAGLGLSFLFRAMWFVWVYLLVTVLVGANVLVSFLPYGSTAPTSTSGPSTQGPAGTPQAGTLSDNFVRCDIDDRRGVEFKSLVGPSFFQPADPAKGTNASAGERGMTVFAGAETAGAVIRSGGASLTFSFPGKAAVTYTMPTDERIGYGITYGLGTASQATSFGTDPRKGDSFQVNVTKYEGNVVEGTFSGVATALDGSKKTTFKNCVFKSSLPITVR